MGEGNKRLSNNVRTYFLYKKFELCMHVCRQKIYCAETIRWYMRKYITMRPDTHPKSIY